MNAETIDQLLRTAAIVVDCRRQGPEFAVLRSPAFANYRLYYWRVVLTARQRNLELVTQIGTTTAEEPSHAEILTAIVRDGSLVADYPSWKTAQAALPALNRDAYESAYRAADRLPLLLGREGYQQLVALVAADQTGGHDDHDHE